ncbi:MAG: exodeoxyribonuclease VII large subunit [Candidatus Dactylopiibacterium sp.]|nr:exodeoxyribonuclease VII large subunit [Candidatus Dactylopiibacterium sp.]
MPRQLFSPEQGGAQVSSVSDFVTQIRSLIEQNSPLRWIGGEIANLVYASSGHVYFTLRDARAQVRCAMWRNRAQLLPFRLAEGMQVEVRAQATVYEARGDLQLSVEQVRRAGLGSLYEAFLRLKARLEAEGLFAPERKRPLPLRATGIALVTSRSGAVLHDVLTVLRRRAPALPVTLYPTRVQGEDAPAAIASAIALADRRAQQDGNQVLLLCRGGGSLEDLWAFNSEAVVRAIAACRLPVVSGVGHETDVTLADFAADLRAATPSAAAEILSADWFALRQRLPELARLLQRSLQWRLTRAAQRTDELQRRLTHPRTRLARGQEALDALARRLESQIHRRQRALQQGLSALAARLSAQRPRMAPRATRLAQLDARLRYAATQQHNRRAANVAQLAARLNALNPEAVLARGYAVVRDAHGGILRDATASQPGQPLEVQLAKGRLKVRVEGTEHS